jgi:hypothetical protein
MSKKIRILNLIPGMINTNHTFSLSSIVNAFNGYFSLASDNNIKFKILTPKIQDSNSSRRRELMIIDIANLGNGALKYLEEELKRFDDITINESTLYAKWTKFIDLTVFDQRLRSWMSLACSRRFSASNDRFLENWVWPQIGLRNNNEPEFTTLLDDLNKFVENREFIKLKIFNSLFKLIEIEGGGSGKDGAYTIVDRYIQHLPQTVNVIQVVKGIINNTFDKDRLRGEVIRNSRLLVSVTDEEALNAKQEREFKLIDALERRIKKIKDSGLEINNAITVFERKLMLYEEFKVFFNSEDADSKKINTKNRSTETPKLAMQKIIEVCIFLQLIFENEKNILKFMFIICKFTKSSKILLNNTRKAFIKEFLNEKKETINDLFKTHSIDRTISLVMKDFNLSRELVEERVQIMEIKNLEFYARIGYIINTEVQIPRPVRIGIGLAVISYIMNQIEFIIHRHVNYKSYQIFINHGRKI